MKKLLLLLFVFLPLFANAQATIQEIPEWNLDQALNNCKKVVMHAYCWMEKGVDTETQPKRKLYCGGTIHMEGVTFILRRRSMQTLNRVR